MAKPSKKNLEFAPPIAVLEPEAPQLQFETPPTPPECEPEPEIEDETTAEPFESAPEAKVNGPAPNKFGKQDQTILDRLMALETWEGVWAYVYRIQPFTNRLVGGNRKVHVRRYDTAFDVQDLMKEAGSGVYQIQATRLQPATGKRPMFDSGEIRILNMNHPPKIPPGEWVDDPKNKEWQWAKEAIEALNKKEAPAVTPPPDPLLGLLQSTIVSQREEMKELRQEMRTAATTAATVAAAANKKDPGEQTFLGLLAPLVPGMVAKLMAPPPDPMAALTAAINLLKTVTPAPVEAPKPLDPTAELDRQLDLQEKIEARLGGGKNAARSRKTGTQEMITDIAAAVGPALTPIVQVIAAGMMNQQRQQQMAAQQQPQGPQQPAAPGLAPGIEHGPMQQQTAQQTGPQLVNEKPTVEGFAAAVLDHLKRHAVGLDLGDWYIEQFGREEFDDLRLLGKARIIEDLKTVPAVWVTIQSQFQDTGELDRMLIEFLTWEPAAPGDDDDEEEDDDEKPVPVVAVQNGWTQQEARP